MARNIFDVLKETLDELREEEFKHFKAKLEDFKIARGKLEKADKCDTAILMTNAYNRNAMQIALQILEVVKRNDLVEKLKDEIRKSEFRKFFTSTVLAKCSCILIYYKILASSTSYLHEIWNIVCPGSAPFGCASPVTFY
uniref:Pyrin domain-containing protein n=1 Tax=Erpetoichthys calabaricus TaxID=27687 RepID=A0A8C4SA14_ERPCA